MKRVIFVAALAALYGLTVPFDTPRAEDNSPQLSEHPKSGNYRGDSRRARRRGGYSYSYSDSINTYGDSRTNYGSADVYRDPMLDRQTTSGPFDHGFFFESGVAPRGGNSPYLN